MAQKQCITFSCYKLTTPQGSTTFDNSTSAPGAGLKTITLSMLGTSVIFMSVPPRSPSGSTDDTVIMTSDGFKFWSPQESADFATGLSATDLTNS